MFVSSPKRQNQLWNSYSLLFNRYTVFPSGVNRLKRDVNHSLPSGSELEKELSCTFTPLYALMECRGKTLRFNFKSEICNK